MSGAQLALLRLCRYRIRSAIDESRDALADAKLTNVGADGGDGAGAIEARRIIGTADDAERVDGHRLKCEFGIVRHPRGNSNVDKTCGNHFTDLTRQFVGDPNADVWVVVQKAAQHGRKPFFGKERNDRDRYRTTLCPGQLANVSLHTVMGSEQFGKQRNKGLAESS
jgi:hypothetical protein